MPAVLTFKSLAPLRSGVPLIQGISGSIYAGQILEITGQNGVGKSSLLDVFSGHLSTYNGMFEWANPTNQPLYIKPKAPLDEGANVLENMLFLSSLYQSSKDQIKHAFNHFTLHKIADIVVRHLSCGQKQRVNLAQLMLGSAIKVWLLDEPFTALDQNGDEALRHLMQEHLKNQGIIVHATHAPLGWGATANLALPKFSLKDLTTPPDFKQSLAL
jgi:heme exporter protein A